MKKLVLTLVGLAFIVNVSAQLKVNSAGNVGVGGSPKTGVAFRILHSTTPCFELEGIGRLQIGVAAANGSFASFAQTSDVVYRPLGGLRHGMIFCMPNNVNDGNHYIKFGDEYNGGWFSIFNNRTVLIDGRVGIGMKPLFNLDVYGVIRGTLVTQSDERLKTNIKPLSKEKEKLYLLQGKSYMKTLLPTDIKDVRYKEDNGESYLVEREEKIASPEYGFLAQELKEVFPDLVLQDSAGYYSVNYIGLIPVIVEALKDQRAELEQQQEQIKQLVKLLNIKYIDEKAFAENGITDLPILLQNTPNPFNQTTEIGYYIPQSVNNANIYIYDVNGLQQRSILIAERGNGSTTIQASALKAGIYFYTLICDGKPVDSKQMILTR
jgi:hypothetical protein